MFTRKITLSLLTVAVIATLVTGASFALFSSSTVNAGNTFTAGTVSLGDPVDLLIDINNIAPGDSGSAGTLAVTYTGSLEAFLGLDTVTAGAIFGGANPLDVTISDGAKTYDENTANQVVGKVNNGDITTFTVTYAMPLAAGNEYQAATGSVSLTVHAVQAAHNETVPGVPDSWN